MVSKLDGPLDVLLDPLHPLRGPDAKEETPVVAARRARARSEVGAKGFAGGASSSLRAASPETNHE